MREFAQLYTKIWANYSQLVSLKVQVTLLLIGKLALKVWEGHDSCSISSLIKKKKTIFMYTTSFHTQKNSIRKRMIRLLSLNGETEAQKFV